MRTALEVITQNNILEIILVKVTIRAMYSMSRSVLRRVAVQVTTAMRQVINSISGVLFVIVAVKVTPGITKTNIRTIKPPTE